MTVPMGASELRYLLIGVALDMTVGSQFGFSVFEWVKIASMMRRPARD
jgi:hypothetical protein